MKLIRQFGIILAITFAGEVLKGTAAPSHPGQHLRTFAHARPAHHRHPAAGSRTGRGQVPH